MKHEKKVLPLYFEQILNGTKTFEVRLADWECTVGDTLVLLERDPNTQDYTGRSIEKTITCISKTKEQPFFSPEEVEMYGFQILGFQ